MVPLEACERSGFTSFVLGCGAGGWWRCGAEFRDFCACWSSLCCFDLLSLPMHRLTAGAEPRPGCQSRSLPSCPLRDSWIQSSQLPNGDVILPRHCAGNKMVNLLFLNFYPYKPAKKKKKMHWIYESLQMHCTFLHKLLCMCTHSFKDGCFYRCFLQCLDDVLHIAVFALPAICRTCALEAML